MISVPEVCRACRSASLMPFFDLGPQPLANSLVSSPYEASEYYDLGLSFCKECTLVQLTADVDASEMFSHYLWKTGTSVGALKHAEAISKKLIELLDEKGSADTVFEVASNDGTFLSFFAREGFHVLGMDPAENLAELAQKKGITTICDYFCSAVAKELSVSHGQAEIVLCRNVLAHVPNIQDFVQGLKLMLGDHGILMIEVHHAGAILSELQYDSIYHEHASYISLYALKPVLEKYDLEVFDAEIGLISGGCMTLFVKHRGDTKYKIQNRVAQLVDSEASQGLDNLVKWREFSARVIEHKKSLNKMLGSLVGQGYKICGFGASARSSTLLNFCGIGSSDVQVIADNNDLKQGLYTAGSRIKIVSPSQMYRCNPDYILILAWNFKQEIIDAISADGFEGGVIIPLPDAPELSIQRL
ncbi:class I SAM-dependent methyltransferase [Litoricolaceae bacterium]|nr:class I SAM-dependent methyltransferase [Litorivicinaceae bacterium]